MQNRKLFEAIEKMVETKNLELKNIKEKENFALDYCQQQLLKKKLIPKDPRIKMNKIMKNFQQLETFINVDQLVSCLNDIFREEKNLETPDQIERPNKKIDKHKRYESEGTDNKNQIQSKLKTFYKDRNVRETEKIREVLKELEETSQIQKQRLKNNSKNVLLQIYDRAAKEGFEKEEGMKKSKVWNYYNKYTGIIESKHINEEEILKSERKIKNKEDYVKKYKLLELAGTYLQMILEKHHRKKWKYEKKNQELEKSLSKVFTKSKIKIKKNFLPKTNHNSAYNSSTTTTSYSTRNQAKANKKFRSQIKNPKVIAMKKLDDFIAHLDDNELWLKNNKREGYGELAYFEEKIKNDFSQFQPIQLTCDEDFQKIQNVIHCQK